MTSCPFLRKLSPSVIQRDIQQLIQLIPRCPFARRLFDGTPLSSPRMYSDVAVERQSDELSVCKNVSECLLKKCPFTVNSYDSTGSNDYLSSQTSDNHKNDMFSNQSCGISDGKLNYCLKVMGILQTVKLIFMQLALRLNKFKSINAVRFEK
ncbi:unnamed protein product [Schistosoma turkestanicum]|nr:unnamed protein product [Schistosoma turkestanicum]